MDLNILESMFFDGARVERLKKDVEKMKKSNSPESVVALREEQLKKEEAEYTRRLSELFRRMEKLNPMEKTVIECRYIKGLTYPSILDELERETGVRYSTSTIIVYRRKALEKMEILE